MNVLPAGFDSWDEDDQLRYIMAMLHDDWRKVAGHDLRNWILQNKHKFADPQTFKAWVDRATGA